MVWVYDSLSLRRDVTPTDRWLNVWCIWYTYLENTSVVSKSLSDWLDYTGFPGAMCVTFFNVCLETKTLWRQTSSRKKVPTNAYQDQRNTGFSKVTLCEIFKVRSIESLKHIPPVCYSDDTPRNMTLNETNGDWLLTCRSNGLMGGPWPMNAHDVM